MTRGRACCQGRALLRNRSWKRRQPTRKHSAPDFSLDNLVFLCYKGPYIHMGKIDHRAKKVLERLAGKSGVALETFQRRVRDERRHSRRPRRPRRDRNEEFVRRWAVWAAVYGVEGHPRVSGRAIPYPRYPHRDPGLRVEVKTKSGRTYARFYRRASSFALDNACEELHRAREVE